MAPRQRLDPETRRRQIAEAARALLLEQGYLPLSMEALATRTGVSKGLIYGYFPSQHDLFNAILAEEMAMLDAAGLSAAAATSALTERAIACAEIYLRHVAAQGPVLHYILRDVFMAKTVDAAAVAGRDRLLRALARQVRRELRLPAAEAVAATMMTAAIPEEMGRLAWQGEFSVERACELNAQLVASAVGSLRPV